MTFGDFGKGDTWMDKPLCEPFELNFRLHVLGGFWPLETKSKWKKVLFSAFSFLCYFSLASMVAIQLADVYILRNDLVRLTRDLSQSLVAFIITVKSILLLYKVDLANALKAELTEFKNSRTDSADVEILEKSNKEILKVLRIFYGMSIPCVIFWILYPGLDKSPEKRVPFPYLLPVEWTPSVYVGVYVYHSMAMIGYMINVVAVDCIFCGFVLRITAHYDIVIKNVKSLGDGDGQCDGKYSKVDEDRVQQVIKDSVRLHQKILEEIKTLTTVYGASTMCHFGGVVPLLGIAIIDLVRVARGFRLQILQKMLYVTIALWDTFLYCSFATKMQDKSSELALAAYSIRWYNMSPRARKDLLFFSFKCQLVPKIKVASLFLLNMKTFVGIIKISYDITALLYQTVNG